LKIEVLKNPVNADIVGDWEIFDVFIGPENKGKNKAVYPMNKELQRNIV